MQQHIANGLALDADIDVQSFIDQQVQSQSDSLLNSMFDTQSMVQLALTIPGMLAGGFGLGMLSTVLDMGVNSYFDGRLAKETVKERLGNHMNSLKDKIINEKLEKLKFISQLSTVQLIPVIPAPVVTRDFESEINQRIEPIENNQDSLKILAEESETSLERITNTDRKVYYIEDLRTGTIYTITLSAYATTADILRILRNSGKIISDGILSYKIVYDSTELDSDEHISNVVSSGETLTLWPAAIGAAFSKDILDFRKKMSFIFDENQKIFDNIFLSQDQKEVHNFLSKFDLKVNQLLSVLGLNLNQIKTTLSTQLKNIYLNSYLADSESTWNDMINTFWTDNFQTRLDNSDDQEIKELFVDCFRISVMEEIFKIAKINSIDDINLVFDKLLLAIDSEILQNTVFNKIFTPSIIEFFGLLFTAQNNMFTNKIAGFYGLSSQRKGALAELDVFLNYLPKVLKQVYFYNEIDDILSLNKFDFSMGKDKISSDPFLNVRENTRYPDQSNWQFIYKTLETFIKITPVKHISGYDASRNILVDALSSLYVQFRANLNNLNLKVFNILISLLNNRHTNSGTNDFKSLFAEVLNTLTKIGFSTLHDSKYNYKGPKGLNAEEIIINIINY
jgi:hypothetical protein